MKFQSISGFLLAAFASVTILSFQGCEPDKASVGKVDLVLKGKYNGNTLVLNTFQNPITYPNGMPFYLQTLKFFITDIKLTKAGGEVVALPDVLLVDFARKHQNATTAVGGEVATLENLPLGSYSGISFGIGVEPVNNFKTPSQFSGSHPLTDEDMYWSAWDSYIFAKVEGRVDTNSNGDFLENVGFLFHTGTNQLFRTKTFTKDFVVTESGQFSINFILDARRIFEGSGADILPVSSFHSPSDATLVKVADNLAAAISLE